MYRLLHIIGTRPQIIKSAATSNALNQHFASAITEIKVDTGQHYDENLSKVFYDELKLAHPKYVLKTGGLPAPLQLAEMISGIQQIIEKENPQGILVYGDTLSTVAGSMIAHTTGLPLFHVEAGLRSYNYEMPEEYNRVITDRASTLLFVPTKKAVQNLVKENYRFPADEPYSKSNPGIVLSGDSMFDNYLHYSKSAKRPEGVSDKEAFVLMTMHRNYNADRQENVHEILEAVNQSAVTHACKVIFPVHPRTLNQLKENSAAFFSTLQRDGNIRFVQPVSYLETIWLLNHCNLVLTDSGGLQKEAYFSGKPCIILRPETEWTELLDSGFAVTVWHKRNLIIEAFDEFYGKTFSPGPLYGNGDSAKIICDSILRFHNQAS